tara:strand:- start:861 stop:1709 length:849 start_codon:yes stop_codon:yes gene_type:complete
MSGTFVNREKIPKGFWAKGDRGTNAKPGTGVTLDSSQFEAVLRELAQQGGGMWTLDQVVRSEASSILAKALQQTGVSTAWRVKAKYTYKDTGKGSDNAFTIPFVRLNGRKVRVRSIKKHGVQVQQKKGWVWKPNKINPEWKLLQAELKRLHKRAKGRKGLAKATWLRIQQTARLPPLTSPKPPAYAYTALAGFTSRLKSASGGKEIAVVGRKASVYYIQIRNYSTTAMAPKHKKGPGGYGAFKKAMRGRVDFFNYSLAKGAFKDTQKMLERYPGIRATTLQK